MTKSTTLVSGKLTRDKAGIEFERSVLMPKDRAMRFAAALSETLLAEAVRDHHASGANYYVRFVRAPRPSAQAAQMADARAMRAADQVRDMEFVPIGSSAQWSLCVHTYPDKTGAVGMYEVSAEECQCPDYEFRCRREGIRCKHSRALLITCPDIAPRPQAPRRSVEERKAWAAANIGNDF